jgi:hypothetical protein
LAGSELAFCGCLVRFHSLCRFWRTTTQNVLSPEKSFIIGNVFLLGLAESDFDLVSGQNLSLIKVIILIENSHLKAKKLFEAFL